MASWNPWHGCRKLSPGCAHCYVYRIDATHDLDASEVRKTALFDLPIKRARSGEYKIPTGETVYTCFSSDFFIEQADEWRIEAWKMIRERSDLEFFFITKRIDRFPVSLPEDWGAGYPNVEIGCTVENQDRADYRLPLFKAASIRSKSIICEPLLERIDLSASLGPWVDRVTVGGESGDDARVCDYAWVLDIRRQCVEKGVPFHFKQTGAKFLKDGRLYSISRELQMPQAAKAGIDLP
jgi:protein gp37